MGERYRFNFLIDQEHRLIVIRPIGDMPGRVLAEQLHEALRKVEAPWQYNRIHDYRRHDGYINQENLSEMAANWAALTAGVDYRAWVAMLVRDACDKLRLPEITAQYPNETTCLFNDYHEAVGWLKAVDRTQYLAGLGAFAHRIRDTSILVE